MARIKINDIPKNKKFNKKEMKKIIGGNTSITQPILQAKIGLETLGDDAQNNSSQKQQQTAQVLSNTAKVLHDIESTVIRKIG